MLRTSPRAVLNTKFSLSTAEPAPFNVAPMSKLVIINLGSGDLHQGFPGITVQIRIGDHPFPAQVVGSLPANPALIALYKNWQGIYHGLCDRKTLRNSTDPDDNLEIDPAGITNISRLTFDELCQQLKTALNTWLQSEGFLRIERSLRSQLAPTDDIRIIVETHDLWLWRLPWQQWELLQDYPRADIALSSPEYRQQRSPVQRPMNRQIRVLAILGNVEGIDVKAEISFLQNLPNTEPTFLINPSRQEFNRALWDRRGWNILFFAGHSQTQAQTGRLFINDQPTYNSLTIEQLEESLTAAIEQGLQLAIFNSCDGLGLALALEKLHIPAVIVMREPVPNGVAQAFFNFFLEDFVEQASPLYLSVRRARRKLQGWEDDFPGASWLPVICQNPAAEPPSWRKLLGTGGYRAIAQNLTRLRLPSIKRLRAIALISLAVTLLLFGLRFLGWFEPVELMSYDQMMQTRALLPAESFDNRLFLVEITGDDIEMQKKRGENLKRRSITAQTFGQEFGISLSDKSLYQLLKVLEPLQPRIIGLDIYRDFPVESDVPDLAHQLQRMPVFGICKAEDFAAQSIQTVDPPPEIPLERVGFNDVQKDDDGVLRRHLLRMSPLLRNKDSKCVAPWSFSTTIAFAYLQKPSILRFIERENYQDLQIGDRLIRVLRSHNGGYQRLKYGGGGSQILLNYRSSNEFVNSISLKDLLDPKVALDESYVRDKIVLIGVTEPGEDHWKTPLSNSKEFPGVIVQAHMISQLVSAALDHRPLIGVWAAWLEALWILNWSFTAGMLTGLLSSSHPSIKRLLPRLGIAIAALISLLYGTSFVLLLRGYWVPSVPTALAVILTSVVTTIFVLTQAKKVRFRSLFPFR